MFIEILANMTQVSDVALGPLVFLSEPKLIWANALTLAFA
jgi:hypothetical protein